MSSISRTRNPLIHSGTSQYERLLQTLTPSYFKIDDRSIKDLLHATYQYAECLHYYDENNQRRGHWQCFWKVEMLTFLAHLSTVDVEAILQGYEDLKEDHRQLDTSELDPEERQAKNNEYLLSLIEYLRSLALRIEEMVLYLPDELPLKQEIIALIEKDTFTDTEQLASELGRLVQFHKEAYKQVHDTRLPASEYTAFFKPYWGIPDRIFFDIELDADSSYQSNEQEDLDQLLKKFEQTFRKIKMRANYWFDLNIDTPQLRQPHVALYLTFLRLFDHARNSLNNLTKKHLEFYYEKILCLDTRAAVPDDAHLILELAATVDKHLIKEGTQFIAGKDKDGKPLLFQTLENWFLNRTQVKNIKTTYLDICGVFRDEEGKQSKKIYATNDVKTAYKAGEEQPNESKDCWRSMGDDPHLPDGEIGFAIASPQLILREGIRVLDIVIRINDDLSGFNNVDCTEETDASGNIITKCLFTDYFELYLSSEEEWLKLKYEREISFDSELDFKLELDDASFNAQFIVEEGLPLCKIRAVLKKDHLPIDALGDDLNEECGFNTQWPIAKIIICKDAETPAAELFNNFRAARVKQIDLNVEARGIQENLIIQSDQGVFDGTQKFYPFGPIPEKGDHFYIGSTEVFQKALKDLDVEFDWIDPPKYTEHYKEYLQIDNSIELIIPSLKIDFIDRATGREAAVPPRFDFLGNITAPATEPITSISGQVTDVTGVGISGAQVTFITTDANNITLPPKVILTNDEGFYSLESTDDFPLKPETQLRFSYLNLEPVHSEGENVITIGIFDPTTGDHLRNYTTINVALYPKRINPSIPYSRKIELDITNVETRNAITDITIESSISSSACQTPSDADYCLDILSLSSELGLKFKYPNSESYLEANIKPTFPKLDVWLPSFKIDSIDGSLADNALHLKIIDPDNQATIINEIEINTTPSNFTVDAPTELEGHYSISGGDLANIASITLQSDAFLPLTIPSGELSFGSGEINEIRHFIKKVAKKIKLSGTIKDFLQEPENLKDVAVKVKGTDIDTDTTDANGEFTIEDIPLEENIPIVLELTLDDYTREIELANLQGDSNIDNITFFPMPASGFERGGTVSTGNTRLVIRVEDNNGATLPLTFSIEGDSSITFAQSGNDIISSEISLPADGKVTLNIVGTNINTSIADVNVADNIETIITLTLPTVSSPVDIENNSIKGQIRIFGRNALETTLSDKNIIVKQGGTVLEIPPDNITITNNGNEISYEISGLEEGSFNSIEYFAPNFQRVIVSTASFLSIDVALLPYPISNVVTGRVTDVFNEELRNVNVQVGILEPNPPLVSTGEEEYTVNNLELVGEFDNENGEYLIYIPNNFQLTNLNLLFLTENFVPTVVRRNIYNRYSRIDIVLYNLLNVFPLIDGMDCVRPAFDINITTLSLKRDIRTQSFTQYSPTLKRGFIRLTLDKGDFLHDEYQNVLIKSTISLANDRITDLPLPNLPYTPATNSIRLNYTSCQTITGEDNENIDDYFYLYPCKGYAERPLQKVEDDGTIVVPDLKLLPQYANPTFKPENSTEIANGNLYIGLENLTPSSNLSLLIQIKEGSEQNPDVEVPEVGWSYLAKDNEWKPLSQSKILTDTTNGLKKTGIFQLTTPSDMSNETTLFEGNCHWLRASVVEKAVKDSSEPTLPDDCSKTADERAATQLAIGLPSIINIRAQAIQVQFLNQENDLSHLAQPLPDGTIQQLLISQSAVKAIEQPFPSFHGRLPEAGDAFYVRVSERLRHRDRAVTIYDYERLLLERFPKIQRAKCLNHTKPGSIDVLTDPNQQLIDTELAPGYVTIAVIPRFSGRTGEAATEPRFSKGDLVDMERYLRTKTNLFVASKDRLLAEYLRVVNPIYEEVRLCFEVQFKAGEAPESRRFDLDRALKGFLSPWLFDNEFDIPFGKSLNRSNIIHFIENQSYVDAIADFKMIHCGVEVTGNEIVPTNSRSILTSVIDEDDNPNSTDHSIHPVDDICVPVKSMT